ncbi:MAG TPA: alpha/beta hydrolase [Thermoleophilaceae bacterium]
MGDYVQLREVRAWYEDVGEGEPLVLLHGGHTDARFFEHNIGALAEHFHVYTPERRGHGHTPDTSGPFSYDLMADETIAFLETVVGGRAHLFGHSDGAFVATLVAMRRPELAGDLVLVSGGFNKNGLIGADEEYDIDELVAFMGPAYAEVSPDGEEHFRVVAQKTVDMAADEPALEQAELQAISSRTLVMFGDDDLVTLEHAVAMYEGIPNAEFAIVPGTSHFLLQEKPVLCDAIVLDFLTREPVPTIAPIRRAAA